MARHLMELDRALVEVAAGRLNRVIIEMPPRHGKSELASKYFTSWYMGVYPERNAILTSATSDLAEGFSSAARDILAEHGQRLFGVRLKPDSKSKSNWGIEGGGSVRAAGVTGSIIGKGADILIVDDYFTNYIEAMSETQRETLMRWFFSVAETRLTPNGAILVIATRWHKSDLIGRLLQDQGDQWKRIRLTAMAEDDDPLGREPGAALWPEQFPLELLERKRRNYIQSGYEWQWEALYQQNPPENLDAEFPPEWFEGDVFFDRWPDVMHWKIMYVDPSLGKTDKADYSAYILLAVAEQDGELRMFIDADIKRRNAVQIVEDGIRLEREFGPQCHAMEGNGFQEVLKEIYFERSKAFTLVDPLLIYHGSGVSKQNRIRYGLTELLARRRIRFRKGSPGVSLLLEQLRGFPATKHDDGPDALEAACSLARRALDTGSFGGEVGLQQVYA